MIITQELLESLVCERFRNDERYRRGHLNILATAPGTRVLGMHTPEMKRVAKECIKDGSWKKIVSDWASRRPLTGPDGLSHEERMIWGLIIDYVKCPLEERLHLLDEFLPAIDNWAICDNFCCNSKWAAVADDNLWAYLERLFYSHEPWSVRVATVLSMCHFLQPDTISRTFATIEGIGLRPDEHYYVRMGVAWLFATALAKNQKATLDFVRRCHLPSDIIKLYIRKARESRITRNVTAF